MPTKYVEIYTIWFGSIQDMETPSVKFTIHVGIHDEEHHTQGAEVRAAVARRALCGLTQEINRKTWKPTPIDRDTLDFLLPGGVCAHVRCIRASTFESVEEGVAMAIDCRPEPLVKRDTPLSLVLTTADLDVLLSMRKG